MLLRVENDLQRIVEVSTNGISLGFQRLQNASVLRKVWKVELVSDHVPRMVPSNLVIDVTRYERGNLS
jgi:hypothetical protein